MAVATPALEQQQPRLLAGHTTNRLAVVNNGTSASYFDLVDGAYQPRFESTSRLGYDSGADTYTLVDGSGKPITDLFA